MKILSISLLSLALSMSLSAVETSKSPSATASRQEPKAASFHDAGFLKEAAMGGMAEVRLGTLARDKAKSPEVKEFGSKMVADHSKANTDLKSVAAKLNIDLPKELGPMSEETVVRLSKLSGADFDKAYVAEMLKDHQKDVAEFEQAARDAQSPDVKSFAERTLPTLREHLEAVRALSK